MIHSMKADPSWAPTHYYFACDECGWCSRPSESVLVALVEEGQHLAAKGMAERDAEA